MLSNQEVVFLICGLIFVVNAQDYEVPEATVEVYKPKGLKVSIPDTPGIKLFAFHGKLNEEFNGREAGSWARDIVTAKNGRWTFYDPQAKIKVGDTLYYWLTVHYFDGEKELGYYKDDQVFRVNELSPLPGKGPSNNNNNNNFQQNQGGGPNKNNNNGNKKPTNCEASLTTVNGGQTACKGDVIFEETFQTTLNTSKWQKDVFIPGSPDYEFVVYMNYPENVQVFNQNLQLRPTLASNIFGNNFINEQINLGRNCTGIPGTSECEKKAETFQILPPVFAGRVKTKESFTFRYGIIEVKAKLPKGNWIYPEIFLQPKEFDYGLDYDSGEMRIAFSPGNGNLGNELQGGVILGTSNEARNFGIKKTNNNGGLWSDDYHIYQMHWKPEGISISVDGINYGNINTPERGYSEEATQLKTSAGSRWAFGGKDAPFDKEFYITLGVGVGGQNFPDNVDSKPWKNKSPKNMLQFWTHKDSWYNTWGRDSALLVDYVRVWAL